jgi:hypothetical protein
MGIISFINLFKMVTVSDYAVRQNQDGESYVVLILQGDVELIQSRETGRFYATMKKCTISTTFSEQVAASQIGKQLPGKVIKEDCDPYEFTIPKTGEVIELSHRWTYVPDDSPVKVAVNNFHTNGRLVEA